MLLEDQQELSLPREHRGKCLVIRTGSEIENRTNLEEAATIGEHFLLFECSSNVLFDLC